MLSFWELSNDKNRDIQSIFCIFWVRAKASQQWGKTRLHLSKQLLHVSFWRNASTFLPNKQVNIPDYWFWRHKSIWSTNVHGHYVSQQKRKQLHPVRQNRKGWDTKRIFIQHYTHAKQIQWLVYKEMEAFMHRRKRKHSDHRELRTSSRKPDEHLRGHSHVERRALLHRHC